MIFVILLRDACGPPCLVRMPHGRENRAHQRVLDYDDRRRHEEKEEEDDDDDDEHIDGVEILACHAAAHHGSMHAMYYW